MVDLTQLDFWTFVLIFFAGSFLLAFLELALKSTPVKPEDWQKAYDLPPGLDHLEMRDGEWVWRDTGKAASPAEVAAAGLVWPKSPPGSPKHKDGALLLADGQAAAPAAATPVGDKKKD